MFAFGAGVLYGLTANGPRQFGTLQDVSVDLQFENKELFGQNQFAAAVARAKGKIQGKAKAANMTGAVINDLFFGVSSLATGQELVAYKEAGAVPAASTYTISVANHTNFVRDLGVVYAASGIALQQVAAGSEALGKYSVAAGVYTFSSADANALVAIDYSYTVTTGTKIVVTNQLTGVVPTFQALFNFRYQNKQGTLLLNNCYSDKLTIASKLDDFTIPEFDFAASADAGGNVLTLSFAE